MTAQPAPFELYALLYAQHGNRPATLNYLGGADFHDATSDLYYYVWLARRDQEVFLIDTGFDQAAAQARGRQLLAAPADVIRQLGVEPSSIEHIILTHLHYDHAGTLDAFPAATFHLQDAEASYATGRSMCHAMLRHPYDAENIVTYVRKLFDGRIRFHSGTATLTPGLSVHLVGGHSAGLQAVRVWTQRGWVVLASDASHLYGNLEHAHPFPIVHDLGDMLEGYRLVLELADSPQHIIPGHDPLVMQRYPAPAPALQGRIVRLDVPPTL